MAMLVVDVFEVIDIEQRDRKRLLVTLRAVDLELSDLVEIAAVVDLGQRIRDRAHDRLIARLLDPLIALAAAARACDARLQLFERNIEADVVIDARVERLDPALR